MWMITGLVGWLGFRVGGHLALSLHSSYELSKLSQQPHHDDSTINIVISIMIIIGQSAVTMCYSISNHRSTCSIAKAM